MHCQPVYRAQVLPRRKLLANSYSTGLDNTVKHGDLARLTRRAARVRDVSNSKAPSDLRAPRHHVHHALDRPVYVEISHLSTSSQHRTRSSHSIPARTAHLALLAPITVTSWHAETPIRPLPPSESRPCGVPAQKHPLANLIVTMRRDSKNRSCRDRASRNYAIQTTT